MNYLQKNILNVKLGIEIQQYCIPKYKVKFNKHKDIKCWAKSTW